MEDLPTAGFCHLAHAPRPGPALKGCPFRPRSLTYRANGGGALTSSTRMRRLGSGSIGRLCRKLQQCGKNQLSMAFCLNRVAKRKIRSRPTSRRLRAKRICCNDLRIVAGRGPGFALAAVAWPHLRLCCVPLEARSRRLGIARLSRERDVFFGDRAPLADCPQKSKQGQESRKAGRLRLVVFCLPVFLALAVFLRRGWCIEPYRSMLGLPRLRHQRSKDEAAATRYS
jgi:hypothetical protein